MPDPRRGLPYGTKYPAEGAPVTKHGGNDPIHDGIETSQEPKKPSKQNDNAKGKALNT